MAATKPSLPLLVALSRHYAGDVLRLVDISIVTAGVDGHSLLPNRRSGVEELNVGVLRGDLQHVVPIPERCCKNQLGTIEVNHALHGFLDFDGFGNVFLFYDLDSADVLQRGHANSVPLIPAVVIFCANVYRANNEIVPSPYLFRCCYRDCRQRANSSHPTQQRTARNRRYVAHYFLPVLACPDHQVIVLAYRVGTDIHGHTAHKGRQWNDPVRDPASVSLSESRECISCAAHHWEGKRGRRGRVRPRQTFGQAPLAIRSVKKAVKRSASTSTQASMLGSSLRGMVRRMSLRTMRSRSTGVGANSADMCSRVISQ